MGFLTRLIAGLVAASTLGAGLASTAGAVDTTGTTGDAKDVVKLASDDTSGLPDHLVNGDFQTYGNQIINLRASGSRYLTLVDGQGNVMKDGASHPWTKFNGWNATNFAWESNDSYGTHSSLVELQRSEKSPTPTSAGNVWGEIAAATEGKYIYQDIATTPGVMYKWSLKHASRRANSDDTMQVKIGDPGKTVAQQATRTTSNGSDKTGSVGTAITTHGTAQDGKWETYSGTYIATSTVTRFTFKSLRGSQNGDGVFANAEGNCIDDVMFTKAYKLSYDKNASDATGKVPSDETAGTVRQTKARTTGTVHLASDDKNGLPDHLVNGDFEYPGANVLSKNRYDEKDANWWGVSRKDKMVYDPFHETQWVSLPSTFDSDKFAWDSTEVAGVQNGSSQWHTNEVELQRDSRTGNMYAELCAYQAQTSIRQYIHTTPGTLYKVRLKHASLSRDYLDKMQVLIGPAGNEQPVRMTRVESRNGLDATGESTASTTVSTHASNEMEIKDGQGTPYSSRNHDGQWATYEGVYVATSDVTSFTFKSVDAKAYNLGNLLDDIVFDKAYRLSYDKNATDANGSVPSDETAGATKQAKSKTNGSVRLAADDDVAEYAANGLPEQIVNGGFDYPSVPSWTGLVESSSNKFNKGKLFATINPGTGKYGLGCAMSTTGRAIPNWNRLNFAWNSTQGDTHYSGGMSCEAGNVELNYDSVHHNQFAELTADQQGTAIYQDVKVTPGTMMKWSLKHSSASSAYVDKMQVLIGEPYKETVQEATRITSENGNKVGERMTTISTPTTSDRADNKKWDTYSGTYLVPDGVTTVRFTFKSVASAEWYSGNDLDDIEFSRSYKLTYDKNSSDAAGEVPSNQRGRENTVQPAKAKTTGTVKTVADGDSSKSLTVNPGFDVPDYSKLDDGGLHWMYVSPAEGKAWSYYDYINPAQPKHQVAGLSQATFGWQELTGGDYKTTLFELHREKDGNVCADVHGSRTIGQTIDTQAGVAYTVSIRHSGRSKGNAGSVQVLVGPDKNHLRPLEMSRMNVSRTGAKYGDRTGKVGTVITTHSDSVDSTEGDHPAWDHSDDWETYSGTYVATGGKTVFAYRGVDKNGNAVSGNDSAADSVIDDLSFKLAYPLAYDKNAQDATGSVPSDMAANTTRPAKSETDGKVSDLVQRTTTHEDGSVTVRTVDQSTDVVSGCQVYYPAGQRITLATLAKDGDCWDSSMLTRPGHTQLGWSQDSQATQAQAEVTMVEGGMTVYAVWVGNPVLTYDTNKPNTWNGQMPSTPASVSVAYNTAAADGSGWQSGDTSKIRGYRFLGWYAGPQDDSGLYDWNTLLTGNVTVYAHWQRLQANVVYDANGGTGSHGTTTGWQYSDVTVPSDTSKSFTRAGYVFLGWDTQADGNGTAYKDGSQVPLQDKDITLYAQWQPVFEQFTPTGGVSLPLLVAGGVTLLVMGIGSTVMLTRRMRGEQ
ncbi:InlB B-repeat-containing protein [Bifidobacterium pseudocatenulatum]|uniref:InlB B-repeat-containing protein n=1 Tax=Bifidobacterium pseudocatenulatum TaxID=28026 RepID=UPI001CFE7ACF|nr:InlB B-repeat-containing protein [Bifidobacterium pseudocatenulatum]MCB4898792.1 InlB B-repeat-containing protein [Bifidobacterium pseudocatenulatum]